MLVPRPQLATRKFPHKVIKARGSLAHRTRKLSRTMLAMNYHTVKENAIDARIQQQNPETFRRVVKDDVGEVYRAEGSFVGLEQGNESGGSVFAREAYVLDDQACQGNLERSGAPENTQSKVRDLEWRESRTKKIPMNGETVKVLVVKSRAYDFSTPGYCASA